MIERTEPLGIASIGDQRMQDIEYLSHKLQIVNVSLQDVDFDIIVGETLQLLCAMSNCKTGVLLLYKPSQVERNRVPGAIDACSGAEMLDQLGVQLPSCSHAITLLNGLVRKITSPSDLRSLWGRMAESLANSSFLLSPLVSGSRLIGMVYGLTDGEPCAISDESEGLDLLAQTAVALEHARLLDSLKQRKRVADALQQTVHDISSSLDQEEVLNKIVRRARELLYADATYVVVKRYDRQDAVIRAADGLITDEYFKSTFRLEEGLCGLATKLREPVFSPDYFRDPRFDRLPRVDEAIAAEGIAAMLVVPLIAHDSVIGALFINSRQCTEFNDDDIQLATDLGKSAALAIDKAGLYESERLAIDNLRRINELVTSRMDLLTKSIDIEDTLVSLLMEGRGTEAIAFTLADLVNRPITVEDHLFRLIVCATPGSSKSVERESLALSSLSEGLQDEDIAQQIKQLCEERSPLRIKDPRRPDSPARVMAPIVAGKDIEGYLSILETGEPLDETGFLMVKRAATILGLEMQKQKVLLDVESRLSGNLLDDLLGDEKKNPDALERRAKTLGVDLRKPRFVVSLSLGCAEGSPEYESLANRIPKAPDRLLVDLARATCTHRFRDALLTTHDGAVEILLAAPKDSRADKVAALVEDVIDEVNANPWGLTVRAGVGRVCSGLGEYAQSAVEARHCLGVQEWLATPRKMVLFDQLGIVRLFLGSEDKHELSSFINETLGPLLDYDARHNSNLILTARTYLGCNGHPQATADSLHIHVNSLVYRLQRIAEISRMDLDDAEARLRLHVALTALAATRGLPDNTPPKLKK